MIENVSKAEPHHPRPKKSGRFLKPGRMLFTLYDRYKKATGFLTDCTTPQAIVSFTTLTARIINVVTCLHERNAA
jgi:hypothetical protein